MTGMSEVRREKSSHATLGTGPRGNNRAVSTVTAAVAGLHWVMLEGGLGNGRAFVSHGCREKGSPEKSSGGILPLGKVVCVCAWSETKSRDLKRRSEE